MKRHSTWNHAAKNTQAATAKVNLFLLTLWRHIVGCRLQLHSSALYGVKLSNSHPGRFAPGENARWKQWIRNWVDPRTGVDALKKRNTFRSCWESTHDCSVVQPMASSVYQLRSPASRTYIFVFRTMCLNRHGHCPSLWVTRNKTFCSFQKCCIGSDSSC